MKVTIEQIKAKIKDETYLVLPDGRSTLCILTLENGYSVKGLSACVDPSEFDRDLGRKYALQDAINQIWPLEGYLLAQRMFENAPITITIPTVEEMAAWNAKHIGGKIVAELKPAKKRGRPRKNPEAPVVQKKRQGRVWTPEARKKQSELARKRWAKIKKAAA